MATLTLDTSVSVKLDGSGNGTVKAGPQSGQRWDITTVTVSTVSQVAPLPACNIYSGPQPQAPWLLDATFTGNGDSTGRQASLYPGNYVWAVWSAGNAADVATIRILGTYTTRYRSGDE